MNGVAIAAALVLSAVAVAFFLQDGNATNGERASVVWVKDAAAVSKRLDARTKEIDVPPGKFIGGLAERKDGVCTIYAHEPKDENDADAFRRLGHELYHCMVGSFHD